MNQLSRLALVLALALALPACGAGGAFDDLFSPDNSNSGAQTDTPPAGTVMNEAERALALEVLGRLNAERTAASLPPLQWHEAASQVGQDHNLDMRRRGFFDHVNPDGTDPGGRLESADVSVAAWGENIARGQDSSDEVMTDWMNSDGHRANILYPDFSHVGIAVLNLPGGLWWTQVFLRE